jgi:outer membrane protein TolC
LVGELETRRLDLLALRKGYDSQDAKLRAAVLAQFPKATLGFNTARDTGNTRTIGFGATIDIPLFDRNQGAIATETATRQQLFDEYAVRVFEARSDLASAAANIESINEQLAAAEAALPAFDRLVSAYQHAERRGDLDALSLYSARSTLLQRKVEISKLKQQLMQNWVALELASGQFLPRDPATTRPAPADVGG